MIDGKNLFDQPVKSDTRTYDIDLIYQANKYKYDFQ